MIKSKLNKILLSSLLAVSSAQALVPACGPKVSVGAEVGYYHYREPNLMKLYGWMGGINGSFNYNFASLFFTTIEGRFLWGKADYNSHGTGHSKGTPQFLFETRALLGHHFSVSPDTSLSPFTGFGYRYKSDHSAHKVTSTGHHGYHRYSQYFYMPFGLRTTHVLNSEWSLALQGEYDLFLRGRQYSDVYSGITHRQKKGYGLKANLDVIKKFGPKKALSFGPYLHFWDIKNSNVVRTHTSGGTISTLEPKNRTYETGLAIKFHF